MSAPSSTALQVALAVAAIVFVAYAAGRVHQWSRHGMERETAYREGYDQASHTLFHLATRHTPAHAAPASAPHAEGSAMRAAHSPERRSPENSSPDTKEPIPT
ncbi:hypothetical protein [Mangrovihabitans endophyticus]|uniref:Uncharacterized protein n=1 Tax=Mangrovihabitans endophyticus TaxID=1751298 RepID=A0A8J3FQN3_9ACTN|nr:hypothetical protein [Mangrovihabitans endophyticus]GGL04763.1 hypothetical protein GCM10012284_44150 [Mangrovihabitans endophyticus]